LNGFTEGVWINIRDLLKASAVYSFDEIRRRANELFVADRETPTSECIGYVWNRHLRKDSFGHDGGK
jgi:hypothetical protein